MPMTIPPFREIFIAENGQVYIEPIGVNLASDN